MGQDHAKSYLCTLNIPIKMSRLFHIGVLERCSYLSVSIMFEILEEQSVIFDEHYKLFLGSICALKTKHVPLFFLVMRSPDQYCSVIFVVIKIHVTQ